MRRFFYSQKPINFQGDFFVDAFNVINNSKKEIDYDKLIDRFGCKKIGPELLEKYGF